MIEQIIDEIQVLLTKFRRQLRDEKTARTCVGTCGGLAREGSNYCQSCMDTRILDTVGKCLTGTAPMCNCLFDQPPKPDCPKHGTTGERTCDECGGKFGHTCYHMGISKPTPDLPLNAKMAMIELTQGKCALVDEEDYKRVNQFKWCVTRRGNLEYAHRRDGNKFIKMHRFILDVQDGEMIDHVNGNGLDNRKSNLRLCTSRENQFNSRSQINSKSKYKGVSWHKREGKWSADIRVDGTLKCLGYFNDEEMAARKYDEFAKTIHGEFVRLNFPEKPLYIKVAEALGHNIECQGRDEKGSNVWLNELDYDSDSHKPGMTYWAEIPPYDTDLVAAMAALEEYKLKKSVRVAIRLFETNKRKLRWDVLVNESSSNKNWVVNDSLPQAICEAIVRHKEAK